MGSGSKKKGGIDMGSYSCKVNEYAAREWGIRNNIYISPFAKNTTEWYISISINGKTSTSPATYEKTEVWKQMYKYYLYYYSKYTKEEIKKEPEVVQKKTIKRQQTTNSADNLTLF